jgi:signal transduction histidine kinase
MSVVSVTSLSGFILDPSDDKKEVIVSITDTGSGISKDIFAKLFYKFVTKSSQGTGLGLYISKSIIEAHGERIWAENLKDKTGSTFIFTLPKVNEDLAGGQGRITDESKATTTRAKKNFSSRR